MPRGPPEGPCRATRASTRGSVVSHRLSMTWVRRTPSAIAWWKRHTSADPTAPSSSVTSSTRAMSHSGRSRSSGRARCSETYRSSSAMPAGSGSRTRRTWRSRWKCGSTCQTQPPSLRSARDRKTGKRSMTRSWVAWRRSSQSGGDSKSITPSMTMRLLGRSMVSHSASCALMGRCASCTPVGRCCSGTAHLLV